MHILVVSQYFWPENFRINDLVQDWVKRGHQVTVLTGLPNYPSGKVFDSYRRKPEEFVHFEGSTIVRVPIFPRGSGGVRLILNYLSFVVSACILGPLRLRGLAIDSIFVFEPSPVTVGLPAIFIGKLKRAPVVFWALDLWPETLAALGVVRSPRVLGWVGHMVRFIYNRCALVLGQSRGFLGSIAKYCDNEDKIRYFPSWAEDLFDATHAKPASELEFRADTFNIVFAGNVGEAQDMPSVLTAAEQLKGNPSVRWIIVGDGRKFNWLQAEVLKRGLQDCVLLPGRFPVERMPSFYAHADALLVSLKQNEVFSMTIPGKVQSYLMSGVPIIGMLDGEGAAIIRDARAGFTCAAGDGFGLAQVVLKMASMNSDDLRALGRNGQKYAQREFGRSQLLDKLETFMQEAVFSAKKAQAGDSRE